jgi:hypothetical protein
LFLTSVRLLVGDRMLVVQAVQCVVASLGAVFLYKLATALTRRSRVGLIAGMLYAAYPLLIRHTPDPSESALMTTLLIAFASAFVASPTAVTVAAAGLCLGLAVLTRTMALPIVPLAAAVRCRSHGWRAGALLVIVSTLVIAPYSIRNYLLNGTLLPTRSGLNLFISNSEHTGKIFPDHGPDVLGEYVHALRTREMPGERAPSPALERELDVMWTRQALEHIRQHPATTLALKAKNIPLFFSPRLVPYHELTTETRLRIGGEGRVEVDNAPPRPVMHQLVFAVTYTPVLVLAAFGVWLRRDDLYRDAVLWCIGATFVAVHAVYFPTTRYRAPIEFIFLFYAAVTLDRWMMRGQGPYERGIDRGISR